MIQSLSGKYKKCIAWFLWTLFYLQVLSPLMVAAKIPDGKGFYLLNHSRENASNHYNYISERNTSGKKPARQKAVEKKVTGTSPLKLYIGGPSSPEATSFKAVGSNNLVNLATGDFSYSIPLLDVGGYPVNLFYSGGITMEQEASWVGLGWNINPGTVSRNMRGVPDDFNGTDLLTQSQNVKPNRTWGGDLGIEIEFIGMKNPKIGIGGSLGFSYNNYLGPALEVGTRVSLSISATKTVEGEKTAPAGLGLTASLGAKLSSRSGLTFSPSISANSFLESAHIQGGVGLSTSYNSRTGIKDLNIHSEMGFYSGEKDPTYEEGVMTDKGHGTMSIGGSLNSTISFAKPSYIPTLRMPMQNINVSGQMELGGAIWGIRPGVSALGYYAESKVPDESKVVKKPLVGYMYAEKANENKNAVMDFNRLNDAEVTPNTPVISAPQYNYDIFSIQGEGTGGNIRAYRSDMGFVRDNVTTSKEKNISAGIDIGIPFHLGINVNVTNTPTKVGGWEDANNTLLQTMPFTPKKTNNSFENVYFKNPGEATVTNEEMLDKVGRDNLVRFKLGGSNAVPRIESFLEQFNKKTNAIQSTTVPVVNNPQKREKRTQVISMLTAGEARNIGLEKQIRNYREGSSAFDASNNLVFDTISRAAPTSFRKEHHISEINVLEQTGMRYIYGLPVYSIKQKDFTFSVNAVPANAIDNLVGYSDSEPTISSEHTTNKAKLDGYVQSQEIPAYASSFLLTGLLSPDYVDVNNDGITEDDLGTSVKFNYTKSADNHKWRTPRNNITAKTAHFNEGIRTENKDNKATISYGERETWYLNSIESKSMVAIFKTDVRNDAKGVEGEMDGKIKSIENANKKLSQIDLYTKAEIKAKGYANAKPIKTVKFDYDYTLCNGSPDNSSGGKLTLKSVYFSYNGQVRNNKDRYVFNYGNVNSKKDNPGYSYNASDRWGTYKPVKDSSGVDNNPGGLTNADYPYTHTDKSKNDIYAGAWSLKKILLPSGGQMEISYEADDYAYVQDRRACNMYNIYGMGKTTSYTNNNGMYNNGSPSEDNYYLYIKLAQPLTGTTPAAIRQEIYTKYLEGISQSGQNKLVCKIQVNMPNGAEPLTVYPEYDDYGLCANSANKDYIYLRLKPVDGKSPLARSAIGFLTENIPGQAFKNYDVEVDDIEAFVNLAGGMLTSLKDAFDNVDEQMRSEPKARTIELAKSFVRLANPVKMKYGGGVRVKSVRVRDNWNKMTGQYTSVYGQDYDYTTTEKINGIETNISSGVASYEPGIGSEENPFREIISFSNKLPLASAQYGAIEMPMLEGLYPSPNVVYSKVTVRSIHRKGTHGDSTLRSAIGKQVTEFYTAKDYPSYSTYTPMEVKDYNKNPFFSFFYKEVINRRTISQGFLVETNDMHGKMKSQLAYSESDEKTPLSASYYTYKNTGKNGLNDKVDFVYNNEQGAVRAGNMGVDVELMTDVREFSVKSDGFNGQLQVDLFTFAMVVVPLPTFFPLKTYVENMYRAVTCTKLINYHAIEDSVIVMDKGSVVSTKTIAYDAETGRPVVTKTNNEFNDPIYNISYPAYWAYSGAGLAYQNINMEFTGANFNDGVIAIPGMTNADISNYFESGDELYITHPGSGSPSCIPASANNIVKLWAYDPAKNNGSFTNTVKNLVFMDKDGYRYTKSNVNFKIMRSGKRNNLGLTVFAATTMANPIRRNGLGSIDSVLVDNNAKVVSTTAIEFREKWQTDGDAFLRKAYYTVCGADADSLSCNGILEKNINPYVKGLIGNFKPYRNYTFYGERNEADPAIATAIRKNGYIKDFGNYWFFDKSVNAYTKCLLPVSTDTRWVWNSELTKVNGKGQELETKDALNIYTAAQYGFAKNMPVSLTQNARYGESFAEGFEDAAYKERTNIGSYQDSCNNNRYINFTGLANGSIVNTENLAFKAHSGKSILSVAANSQVVKTLKVANSTIDNYDLKFGSGIVLNTTGPYGTSSKVSSVPASEPVPSILNISYGASSLSMSYNISSGIHHASPYLEVNSNGTGNFRAFYKTTQYIKVTNPLVYTFYLNTNHSGIGHHLSPGEPPPSFFRTALTLVIRNSSNITVFTKTLYSDQGVGSWSGATNSSGTVFLPCGEYTVEASPSSDISYQDPPLGNIPNSYALYQFNSSASYSCNPPLYAYQTSCTYQKPISGTDSMLNPAFNLVPAKKMQFSAWVKEDCTVPCTKTDFNKSNIEIWAGGTNIGLGIIKRTGTIIEGWQKIEGEFTVPQNAATAELRFINTNTVPMYVDDIRIHPFNANMKSYVYDPRTLRLSAELDENNYTSFYEYDEEGQLIRLKKETIQGIKTIKETRSAKQKLITEPQ